MALISPILSILLLFLNVFDTFKTLKPPATSTRNKGRPSVRAITQRKRDMKGILTLWMVWSCLLAYERMGERFIRVFIPFYDEFKCMLLILLMTTRSKTSEPIYLHIIRPAIKPHTATLDPILNAFTGACDFILFVLSIPFQDTPVEAAPDVLTPPDTDEMAGEPDTVRTQRPAGMRQASSKATLSTLRNVERIYPQPPFASPSPRRLDSDLTAAITSPRFWSPPSPAQSSPESRRVLLPPGFEPAHSSSDSATLYHTSEEVVPGIVRGSSSEGVQVGPQLMTPRRNAAYGRYGNESDGDEEEDSEDEFNVTLQTPKGTHAQPHYAPFRLHRSDDEDNATESDSSVGTYSAVLSTNGNASSLRTRSTSGSSSDLQSDSDSSIVGKRINASQSTLAPRPPVRQPMARPTTRINPSAPIPKPSAYPRKRQPASHMAHMSQPTLRGVSGGMRQHSDVDADVEGSDANPMKTDVNTMPKMRKTTSDPVPVVSKPRSGSTVRPSGKPVQARPGGASTLPKRGPVPTTTTTAARPITRTIRNKSAT